MLILSLNAGSSSLKFALYSDEEELNHPPLVRGSIAPVGRPEGAVTVSKVDAPTSSEVLGTVSLTQAVTRAIDVAAASGQIDAVGCRVVHGGPDFDGTVLVTSEVLEAIRRLSPLAPLHNASDVATIRCVNEKLRGVPVFAVFDTAFHRSLPKVASQYALPHEISERFGIRRYGFHGISYLSVWNALVKRQLKYRRLVVCHLGSGASVCAIQDGKSIDTSMGLTPLEGLVMGTRSGDIDPGLFGFLQRQGALSIDEVEKLLNEKSGLLGLSGLSSDLRTLEETAESGDAQTQLALEVFAYRVAKYVGAYAVALNGLDGLVFTGGIGEHSVQMRSRIGKRLASLNVHLDTAANRSPIGPEPTAIHESCSLPVWVVPADEEGQIAREVKASLVKAKQPGTSDPSLRRGSRKFA